MLNLTLINYGSFDHRAPRSGIIRKRCLLCCMIIIACAFGANWRSKAGSSRIGGEALKANAINGRELHEFELFARVYHAVFSSDGELLAIGDSNRLLVREMQKGAQKLSINFRSRIVAPFGFSPTGDRVYAEVSGDMKTIRCWDIPSDKELFSFPSTAGMERVTPDGKHIVTVTSFGKIQRRDAKDGKLLHETPGREQQFRGYSLSWDGKILIESLPDEKSIKVHDLETNKVKLIKKHGGGRFSPSGKLLAYGLETMEIWDTQKWNLQKSIKLPASPHRAVISHDDEWLAATFHDKVNEVAIYSIATGERLWSAKTGKGMAHALAFSPKGNLLAASSENVVYVWELSKKPAAK